MRVVPVYMPGDSRWGLEALVGMIDRAAKGITKQWPDAKLSIGHLSRMGGGEIDRRDGEYAGEKRAECSARSVHAERVK